MTFSRPLVGATRSPHCSRTAVDNEGPANSEDAEGAAGGDGADHELVRDLLQGSPRRLDKQHRHGPGTRAVPLLDLGPRVPSVRSTTSANTSFSVMSADTLRIFNAKRSSSNVW